MKYCFCKAELIVYLKQNIKPERILPCRMVDTHCHLNFKAFEEDVDEVIKNALDAGVTKIINVGTKQDSNKKAIELAEKYENLYASVGVHPHHADKLTHNVIPVNEVRPESDPGVALSEVEVLPRMTIGQNDTSFWEEFEELAKHPKVVAIGECGMDFYRYESNGMVDPKLQKEIFIKQIEIAHKLKLPLQIHNRHGGKEVIDILLNHKSYLLNPPGVFHCFSGDIGLLKSALQMNFYIGFDGNITYKGLAKGETTDLKDLVKLTPLDRILTETDSPYLTPIPHRGTRNEPKYVIIIGKAIADIKGVPFEKVSEQTTKNAERLFNF